VEAAGHKNDLDVRTGYGMNRSKIRSVFVLRRAKTEFLSLGLGLASVWLSSLGCIGHADIIETFDTNSTNMDWMLTTNPLRLLRIEPAGGNPAAYLHGQVQAAAPTWYAAQSATNFFGDYAAKGVTSAGADINIFVGNTEPDRNVTLDLSTTLGTGDISLGLEAYYIGQDISNVGPGWNSYVYPLDANSTAVPSGWTLLRGDGTAGEGKDWQALMHDVEAIAFELGTPGFLYTDHTVFDLGLDNPRLITATLTAPTLAIAQLSNTQFRIDVNGVAGQTVVLQSSTDLPNWLPIATNSLSTTRWEYVDSPPINSGTRFYRAALSR
jgi:hypothetical protein